MFAMMNTPTASNRTMFAMMYTPTASNRKITEQTDTVQLLLLLTTRIILTSASHVSGILYQHVPLRFPRGCLRISDGPVQAASVAASR